MNRRARPPADWDEAADLARLASFVFASTFDDDALRRSKSYWDLDRGVGIFDEGRPVATASSYAFELSVPGAAHVAAGGISGVAVLPTHRRQGLLRTLMRFQLDDLNRREEPLAVLWASEAPIYGRFGYGMGTRGASWSIARADAALSPGPAAGERLELVAADGAAPTLAPVYELARALRPGMISRSDGWWSDRRLVDPTGELNCVVVRERRQVTGYALYTVSRAWNEHGIADHTVNANEVVATTTGAYRAVWQFLLDLDLSGQISTYQRPLDDPLVWMLRNPRALRTRVIDGLWVRLVDVPGALAARRYRTDTRLVLDVVDGFCPWNEGRWLLEGGPDGATCGPAPKRGRADLRLSAADLGAIYLGGQHLAPLVTAGRVEEFRPGALRRADLAFGWDVGPWPATYF